MNRYLGVIGLVIWAVTGAHGNCPLSPDIDGTSPNPDDPISVMLDRAESYVRDGRYDSAFCVARRMKAMERPEDNQIADIHNLFILGIIKAAQFQSDSARILLEKGLDLVKTIEPDSSLQLLTIKGRLLFRLGYMHMIHSASYELVQDYVIQSLKIGEKIKDNRHVFACYRILAFNQRLAGNTKEALEYAHEALLLTSGVSVDTSQLISVINEIGNNYGILKMEDSMRYFQEKALKMAQEIKDSNAINYIVHDIGHYFLMEGQYDAALNYLLEAHQISKKRGHSREEAVSSSNLGHCYLGLENLPMSIFYFTYALDVAAKNNLRSEELNALEGLAEAFWRSGQTRKAYIYLRKHNILSDSLFNSEKSKLLDEIQVQYKTEKKQRENDILKYDIAMKELSLRHAKRTRNFIIWIFGTVVLFIGLMTVVLLIRNKEKVRANRLLAQQNEEIISQRDRLSHLLEALRNNEAALLESNATKDKFFSIIAHDLKNPVAAMAGLTDFMSAHFSGMSESDRMAFFSRINASAASLSRLVENLLQWSRTQNNKVTIHPEDLSVRDLVDSVTGTLSAMADRKQIRIVTVPPGALMVRSDRDMAEFILRNLVSNAIKFSHPGGQVWISAYSRDTMVIIGVRDEGMGITEEQRSVLFKTDNPFRQRGTGNEEGTGLGLAISKEFVERNGGEIWAEKANGKGSGFFFSLPAANKV